MYRRIHDGSTPCGSPGCGCLLGDPQGVVGDGGVERYTSVTALPMTDVYGASTPPGCTAGWDAGKSSSGGTPSGVHCRKARRGLCRTSRTIDGWRHPCASDRVSSLGRAVVEEEPEEDPGDERIAGEDKPALREADPINHKARRIGTDRGAEPIRHHQEDALSR